MVYKNRWVYFEEDSIWEYNDGSPSGWTLSYREIDDSLVVNLGKSPYIVRLDPYDHFDNYPNITEDELTLFELEFGVSGEPLLELQQLLEQ